MRRILITPRAVLVLVLILMAGVFGTTPANATGPVSGATVTFEATGTCNDAGLPGLKINYEVPDQLWQYAIDAKEQSLGTVFVVDKGMSTGISGSETVFLSVSGDMEATFTANYYRIDGLEEVIGQSTLTIRSCTPPPDGDSDNDGVPNSADRCSDTPAGTPVDANGCPLPPPDGDSDNDGVPNSADRCSDTPAGTPVDANGCPVVTPLPLASQTLKAPVKVLKKGKAAKLAKATQQGAKVKWKSMTKTCKVKGGAKATGIKKGVCRLKATAAAVPNYKALKKIFKFRVK